MSKLYITLTAAVLLSACSGGSYVAPVPAPLPPPPTAALDFTTFIKDQIGETTETGEPVEINELSFDLADQDNPNAFDDLFTSP